MKPKRVILYTIIPLLFGSCASYLSDFQDAKSLGNGRVEVSGYANDHIDDDYKYSNFTLGKIQEYSVQAAYGLSDRLDIMLRHENTSLPGFHLQNDFEVDKIWSFGGKYGLIKDRLAIATTVGTDFRRKAEPFTQVRTSLLLSVPDEFRHTNFSWNASVQYLNFACVDCNDLWTSSLGISLRDENEIFVFRPALAYIHGPESDPIARIFYLNFSFGLVLNPNYFDRDK